MFVSGRQLAGRSGSIYTYKGLELEWSLSTTYIPYCKAHVEAPSLAPDEC